ncbi:MAG: biotin transporter BioY [Catonella sp.]|jgi:hypothetical protein
MSSNENVAVKSGLDVKSITLIGIMAAICCVLGPWQIPIGPVPISLQIIAVCLSAYVLGAKRGALAVLTYVLLGLIGLPVFAGASGGAATLFGPTGGYIIGFIFMAFISGLFIEKFGIKKVYFQVAGLLLGLLVCYLFGTVWFTLVNTKGINFTQALGYCVYPFIPFDIAKIVISVILGNAIRQALNKFNA